MSERPEWITIACDEDQGELIAGKPYQVVDWYSYYPVVCDDDGDKHVIYVTWFSAPDPALTEAAAEATAIVNSMMGRLDVANTRADAVLARLAADKRKYIRLLRQRPWGDVGSVWLFAKDERTGTAFYFVGGQWKLLQPGEWEFTSAPEADAAPMGAFDFSDQEPTPAAQILRDAEAIVAGRRSQHGAPERSFAAAADFWNAYLANRSDIEAPLKPSDVAALMGLLKVARRLCGEPLRDHSVDECGYAALCGELVAGEVG